MLAHRLDPAVIVGSPHNGKLSALRSGHCLRRLLRLLGRNSRTESPHSVYGDAISLSCVICEAVCNPDVGCGKELGIGWKVQLKVWPEDADDDGRRSLWSGNRNRASDHGGISSIPALEVLVAQDRVHRQRWRTRSLLWRSRRWRRVGDGVVIIEIATVSDAAAKQAKEVDCHYCGIGLLRSAVLVLKRERKGEDAGEILENRPGTFAQIDEVGVRKREIADVALAQIADCDHNAVRIAVRQRPEYHCVRHAEDGSTGPDSQSNRQYCCQGEHRALAQYTSGQCQIARIHSTPPERFGCNLSTSRCSRAISNESCMFAALSNRCVGFHARLFRRRHRSVIGNGFLDNIGGRDFFLAAVFPHSSLLCPVAMAIVFVGYGFGVLYRTIAVHVHCANNIPMRVAFEPPVHPAGFHQLSFGVVAVVSGSVPKPVTFPLASPCQGARTVEFPPLGLITSFVVPHGDVERAMRRVRSGPRIVP